VETTFSKKIGIQDSAELGNPAYEALYNWPQTLQTTTSRTQMCGFVTCKGGYFKLRG